MLPVDMNNIKLIIENILSTIEILPSYADYQVSSQTGHHLSNLFPEA